MCMIDKMITIHAKYLNKICVNVMKKLIEKLEFFNEHYRDNNF